MSFDDGGDQHPDADCFGREGRFVTRLGFSDSGRRVVDKDPTIGRMTIPEGDFSRQWDLQGRSGVAVRTEVSAQTGTSDVTPLFVCAIY